MAKSKLPAELKSILKAYCGDEGLIIGKELLNLRGEITDEELHARTEVKLNQVRKILYILHDVGLTEFKRLRDKKSGWFIYFWVSRFNDYEAIIKKKQREVLEILDTRLSHEENHHFFVCQGEHECDGRYTFDQAFDEFFKCPICKEGQLSEAENTEIIQILKKRMKQLRGNINS